MANLQYKTRGNDSPQGNPRVYFCCHPEDFNKYFETVSEEILQYQRCAIWYASPDVVRDEDFFLDLKQMQLCVMPVTTNLLCTENEALDAEFKFAMENHIPVLPLMQESGLEEIFNKKCGDLQFLDKNNMDATAIDYKEKLKKYLDTVLIGDELAEKIRAAFDAYVFLSYRKKDRRYAQELMRLIHKNEFCRDIAIWYDEFLTPGENFNDSIKEAIQKSGLFVLAVTPNLVNETNYIMTTEYPMAKQEGKLILPAELVPTDRERLLEQYADIPNPTDPHNASEFSDALLASIKQIAIKESDHSPEHNFFIGLAYLGGIDVEVDYTRAVEIITSAAEAGLSDAMEKLIDIYEKGIGVTQDYSQVVLWQRRLYESIKSQVDLENTTELELKKYGDVSFGLEKNLKNMGYGDEGIAIRREYYEFYEAYKLRHCKDNPRELAEMYDELSLFYNRMTEKERGKTYLQKAFSFFVDNAWECDKKTVWLFLGVARRFPRFCDEEEKISALEAIQGVVRYIEQSRQMSEQATEDESFEILNDVYEDVAIILKDAKQYDLSKEYYLKSYALVTEKINFSQPIERRIIDRVFSILQGLKSLKWHEENDSAAKEYASQSIDWRLKYIDSLERFEKNALLKVRMISEQYSEIADLYRYLERYSDAVDYAKKHCEYLEKEALHHLTIESARCFEDAYSSVLGIYKTKERLSLELSDEEKQDRICVIRKRIQILNYILEYYKKEENALLAIGRMKDALNGLIADHMSLGETEEATKYSEEKLKLLLKRYEMTKFLADAYYAYYDTSDFYKKIEQHDKAIKYLLLGITYEEKEIKGQYSRENQERLAYRYRNVGDYYFTTDVFDKGYAYLTKALQIKLNIHKTYNDEKSAKALYFAIWDLSERIEKKQPNAAKLLQGKMAELRNEWPGIW